MSRVAAMDLGSNTLRLLVAEVDARGLRPIARKLATPRLAKDLKPGGELAPEACSRTLQAVAEFAAYSKSLGAEKIILGATQACRQARNGAEFVKQLAELVDRAQILTSREEIKLTSQGVAGVYKGSRKRAYLLDLGGGSTEIMELAPAAGQEPWHDSLIMGVVAYTDAHLHRDPPLAWDLAETSRQACRQIKAWSRLKPARLLATAGTATALAALQLGLTAYEPDKINNTVLNAGQVDQQIYALASLPLAQRRLRLGSDPSRAEVIIAGAIILREILGLWNLKEMTVIDAGLLEGLLLSAD